MWFGGRRVGVRAIVDRWFAPSTRWYRVDADDGQLYVLRHDLDSHAWDLAALTRRGALPDDAIVMRASPHAGPPS